MKHTTLGSRSMRIVLVSLLTMLVGLFGFSTSAGATGTKGYLEICKTKSGEGVSGEFQFTVSGIAAPVAVPVGLCSMPIEVTAGEVTVTEVARAGFVVAGITTFPIDRLVSGNTATGVAALRPHLQPQTHLPFR